MKNKSIEEIREEAVREFVEWYEKSQMEGMAGYGLEATEGMSRLEFYERVKGYAEQYLHQQNKEDKMKNKKGKMDKKITKKTVKKLVGYLYGVPVYQYSKIVEMLEGLKMEEIKEKDEPLWDFDEGYNVAISEQNKKIDSLIRELE